MPSSSASASWSSAFRADHGRAPTAVESLALAQQANLETRPAKHEPRCEAEQRREWWAQASALYAGGRAGGDVAVAKLVAAAVGTHQGRNRERGGDGGIAAGHRVGTLQGRVRERRGGDVRPQVVADRVLEVLEGSRATWQVWHVRAETLRQARAAEVPLAELEELRARRRATGC